MSCPSSANVGHTQTVISIAVHYTLNDYSYVGIIGLVQIENGTITFSTNYYSNVYPARVLGLNEVVMIIWYLRRLHSQG